MGIFERLFGNKPRKPERKLPAFVRRDRQAEIDRRRKQEQDDEERAYKILETGHDPKREAFDRESEAILQRERERLEKETTWTEWHDLVSSNVDRTRYLMSERTLQIVFKDGTLYEYYGVEPEVFQSLLQTHSPGQWRWQILGDPRGGYSPHYDYKRIGGGYAVSPPAADRFSGRPFAIPAHIETILAKRRAFREPPVAKGAAPPPPSYRPES